MGGACNRLRGFKNNHKILCETPEGKDHLEEHGVGGKIILKRS
jgi:hypothetical protein